MMNVQDTLQKTKTSHHRRDHVNTQRFRANQKHLRLTGVMTNNRSAAHVFNVLIKSWFRASIQDKIQIAKAFYVEVTLGSSVEHNYGYYYTDREALAALDASVPLSVGSISVATGVLEKLGVIEKGKHLSRPTIRQKKAMEGTNKVLKRRINQYRPNFKGIFDLAIKVINANGLRSEYTTGGRYGSLDNTRIWTAILGVEIYSNLMKEVRKLDLFDLDEHVRTAIMAEDEKHTKKTLVNAVEPAREADLKPLSDERKTAVVYITSNEVSNIKLTKTSPDGELKEFKKLDLKNVDGYGVRKRHIRGIQGFLAGYTRPRKELLEPKEDRDAPFVDLAITSESPALSEPTWEDVKGVLQNMAKSVRKRSRYQPDFNTQLSRNWRAEMFGSNQPQNALVRQTDEIRGRYRVLESTQTHEKVPPVIKTPDIASQAPDRLENALQRLLNASEGQATREATNLCENPVVAQNATAEDDEDRLIRERIEAKRKLLGLN